MRPQLPMLVGRLVKNNAALDTRPLKATEPLAVWETTSSSQGAATGAQSRQM